MAKEQNRFSLLSGVFALAMLMWGGVATAETAIPAEVAHRREVRRLLSQPATRPAAVEAALQDADPAIRRYALLMCVREAQEAKNDSRATELAKRFLTDPDVTVRVLAKAINRRQALVRENLPFSQSPHKDFAEKHLQHAVVTNGVFELTQPVPRHEGIELWFGKPKQDLFVWLNGRYLGQFDSDLDAAREFRLDATQETNLTGVNRVVVKDAAGKEVQVDMTVEVLSWRF